MLAISLVAFWVEIPADSARTLSAPDSTGTFPIDSTAVFVSDTSLNGLVRPAVIISFSKGIPYLLQELGYCAPPDSSRRFFALCSEAERWFQWQE